MRKLLQMGNLEQYYKRLQESFELLMAGVVLIAVVMTPVGVWRLRKMDLVEKVKDLSQ
jgi:hypothetical protein